MIKSMKTLLSLAIATALAGCTLEPTYERPEAPISEAYPTGTAYPAVSSQTNNVSAADIGWRNFFADPLLQQLIALSLTNNRDLRVATLNVEAARAQYRIQRSDLLPGIGIGAKETAQRMPADLAFGGVATTSRDFQVGAVMSAWELDLFGRIRSLSNKALEAYLALDETRQAAQLALIAEVANAYLALRADQELLNLTRETYKSQQSSYQLTNQSYEQGVATALDLSQAEVLLRTAERNLAQYTRQAAQDRNALVLLIGQPLTPELASALDQATQLQDGLWPTALPVGLPSALLARRPDIRAAEHQLKSANANIGAARAAFFPTISLTGTAGTASASLNGLFESGSGAWTFLPQITLPLFAGGSLWAGLDVAKIQKQIQVAQYEKSIQTAFREVADALAGRGTLDEQMQAQQKLVAANQRAYDLSTQRFRQGVDSYLNVLDAQRSLYSAQQTLVDTRRARLSNLVSLYKTLGGGWIERTGRNITDKRE